MRNPFTEHPRSVGEGYFEHLRFASGVGGRMLAGGLACFVHAFFPFLCATTGSRTIIRLHARVTGAPRIGYGAGPGAA